jgi:hypothetical protein
VRVEKITVGNFTANGLAPVYTPKSGLLLGTPGGVSKNTVWISSYTPAMSGVAQEPHQSVSRSLLHYPAIFRPLLFPLK